MRIVLLLFFAAVAFSVFPSFAQNKELKGILDKFNDYQTNTLQEKLYVHLDRNFLLTGETLWFKIYTVDGTFHKPLDISKVAYMEILDKNNTPVLQSKITLKDGLGNGSVFIPASLNSGNYRIRFYTAWMRNSSPEFYFQRPITFVNPFIKLDNEKGQVSNHINVEFFPEGGNLVEGLESKVAFRVTDSQGRGVAFRGSLINHYNDTLVRFSPLQFGLGFFIFTPEESQQYKVVIQRNHHKPSIHPIPDARKNGYVMKLEDDNEKIIIDIKGKPQTGSDAFLYFLVHARQKLTKAEVKFTEQNGATFIINKNELAEGISHFTIFNSKQEPVCERLYFKHPNKKLKITIESDQQEYAIRRKAKFTLKANTSIQNEAEANLSVSVYKIDSLDGGSFENIFSYLWLSSDLQGQIESPEFYFDTHNTDKEKAIDHLMLTHGWRRFNWDEVLHHQKKIEFIPEYRGHIIKGKVSKNDNTPASGILTYLSSPGKNIRLYGARSNAKGEVLYEVKDFWGPRKIIVQTNTNVDSTYKIQITNPFSDKFSTYSLPPFHLSPAFENKLVARSISMQVQDIYHESQSNRVNFSFQDSIAFYGNADQTYFLDNYTRFPVMEEVMREYVPGVLVRKRRDGFHFIVLDNVNKGVLPENPMVLLDGVPVFDIDKIMAYDPLKVKKLEVITRKYYLGPLFLPGIVSYSTYNGDLTGFELDPRSISMNYEGLQLQREFYVPSYDHQKNRSTRLPDQRTLLYWAPNINTGKDGKHELEFFTSDVTGRYLLVVQGLTKDGFAGSSIYTFSVTH